MADDWKVGKQGKSGLKKEEESAVLVGIVRREQTLEQIEEYLDELEFLALDSWCKNGSRDSYKK